MLQSFKASVAVSKCLSLPHVARGQAALHQRTYFAPTAARRADPVQDLYLREIKNYKQPSLTSSDAEGHVQKFTPPKAPQSPEESDIANDLKAYEEQVVEVEGQAPGGSSAVEEDWFEEEEEEAATSAH